MLPKKQELVSFIQPSNLESSFNLAVSKGWIVHQIIYDSELKYYHLLLFKFDLNEEEEE